MHGCIQSIRSRTTCTEFTVKTVFHTTFRLHLSFCPGFAPSRRDHTRQDRWPDPFCTSSPPPSVPPPLLIASWSPPLPASPPLWVGRGQPPRPSVPVIHTALARCGRTTAAGSAVGPPRCPLPLPAATDCSRGAGGLSVCHGAGWPPRPRGRTLSIVWGGGRHRRRNALDWLASPRHGSDGDGGSDCDGGGGGWQRGSVTVVAAAACSAAGRPSPRRCPRPPVHTHGTRPARHTCAGGVRHHLPPTYPSDAATAGRRVGARGGGGCGLAR